MLCKMKTKNSLLNPSMKILIKNHNIQQVNTCPLCYERGSYQLALEQFLELEKM